MRPHEAPVPAGVDPAAEAMEQFSWGDDFSIYLTGQDGSWHVWLIQRWEDEPTAQDVSVYALSSLTEARSFMAAEQALLMSCSDHGRLASAVVFDADDLLIFTAQVHQADTAGPWLVTRGANTEGRWRAERFTSTVDALEAYAAATEDAALHIADRDVTWPEISAAYLRDQAAQARAAAARVSLGDALRALGPALTDARAVTRVASEVGVSRPFLYRVLAGDQWTSSRPGPNGRSRRPRVSAAARDADRPGLS